MTCAECVHYYRCAWLLRRAKNEAPCDWSPSRFVPISERERVIRGAFEVRQGGYARARLLREASDAEKAVGSVPREILRKRPGVERVLRRMGILETRRGPQGPAVYLTAFGWAVVAAIEAGCGRS